MKKALGVIFLVILAAYLFGGDNKPENPAQAAKTEAPRRPTSVDHAFSVCAVVDSTGMASKPCDVSGWNSAVIATIDMTSAQARAACAQMASAIRDKGIRFDNGWTIQIRSPYSGENSIAFCNLPT